MTDWIDKLLGIGACFDWITPAVSFAQDAVNGPVYDFGIKAGAGFTRGDVKKMLNRAGVKNWGRIFTISGILMVTVNAQDAETARAVFAHYRVPLDYGA